MSRYSISVPEVQPIHSISAFWRPGFWHLVLNACHTWMCVDPVFTLARAQDDDSYSLSYMCIHVQFL